MSKRKMVWLVSLMLCGSLISYWFWQMKTPFIATVVSHEMNLGGNAFTYPQLANLPSKKVQTELNDAIRTELERFGASLTVPETEAQSEYKVHLNQGDIISLSITEFYYVKRAAHPMTYLRSFSFNVRNGQKYFFKDLFRPNSDYETVVNQLVKKHLLDQQVMMLRPFQGVTDKQEFFLTADDVVVYYQLYEYTPYVYGFLKVSIPYSQLEGVLVPEILQAVKINR